MRDTIEYLQDRQLELKLGTADLCFLTALAEVLEMRNRSSAGDELMRRVYAEVLEVTEPEADNVQVRATHAFRRLRDQQLLARVDGAGLVRPGDYTLTTLARGIVGFYNADQVLTRENLTMLMASIKTALADVRRAAGELVAHGSRQMELPAERDDGEGDRDDDETSEKNAEKEDEKKDEKKDETARDWQQRVVGPLRVTVSDLVAGIETRQRGLDAEQERVREVVSELLQEDWSDAIDRCESLLEDTTATLRELHEVLLDDTADLGGLLAEIEEMAARSGHREAVAAVQEVADQLERVQAWSQARFESWSDYFQYVQQYLRSVVRLDPQRALSQRIRQGLQRWNETRWKLCVVDPPAYLHLREPAVSSAAAQVARPHRERSIAVEDAHPDSPFDDIAERVDGALREREDLRLSELVEEMLEDIPEHQRYAAVGAIAHELAERGHVVAREYTWTRVSENLEIQDWKVKNSC